MTTFSIRAFTGEDAVAVRTWRYPPPYGVYGSGLGAAFVEAAMGFARDRWAPRSFGLDVFPLNERAIRSYERAGFSRGEIYLRRFDGGNEVTFLRMGRPA